MLESSTNRNRPTVSVCLILASALAISCGTSTTHTDPSPNPREATSETLDTAESGDAEPDSGTNAMRSPPAPEPPHFIPSAWQPPPHVAADLSLDPHDRLGMCDPPPGTWPVPCKRHYTKGRTVMEAFCTSPGPESDHEDAGLLVSSIRTYAVGEESPSVTRERIERTRDGLGRVTDETLHRDPSRNRLATETCRFAYEGKSDRVSWRACDTGRGHHFVYDEEGRVAEVYEAEKRTADLDVLRGWVPPDGPGFWSYIYYYEYDDDGRIIQRRKCNGQPQQSCYHTDHYDYDPLGRLVKHERIDDGKQTRTTTWDWDDHGLLRDVVETWPGGSRRRKYDYDSRERLVGVRVDTRTRHGHDFYEVDIDWSGPVCEPEGEL